MQVGAMNHVGRPVAHELERIAGAGYAFVDLTLEPPGAWPADGSQIRRLLDELGLAAVGHTAPYLPIASPLPPLADAARDVFGSCLDTFAAAGIELVNVHPQPLPSVFAADATLARNAEAITVLAEEASRRGIRLMVENLGYTFGTIEELAVLFEAVPELGFHLDVGHTNIASGGRAAEHCSSLLSAFGERLAHVHVHDNLGDDDLHLPLGAGTIDWPAAVAALKASGWDGTVTIEVFGEGAEESRRAWLEWWDLDE